MNVEIDEDRCVGSGQCVLAMPDVFAQRDTDSVSEVRREPDPDRAAEVERVARVCPAAAITVS